MVCPAGREVAAHGTIPDMCACMCAHTQVCMLVYACAQACTCINAQRGIRCISVFHIGDGMGRAPHLAHANTATENGPQEQLSARKHPPSTPVQKHDLFGIFDFRLEVHIELHEDIPIRFRQGVSLAALVLAPVQL